MNVTRAAALLLAGLAAVACGRGTGSPTAPTLPAAEVLPTPAPVSQTLTGTWFLGSDNFMTVTQDGTSVVGMLRPAVAERAGAVITHTGTITGNVSGSSVNLSITGTLLVVLEDGSSMRCASSEAFDGTLSGNSLNGVYSAGAWTCPSDAMPADIPRPDGRCTFTRQ